MRSILQIDPRCRFRVGERTPERRVFIARYVQTIMDLLGEYQGHPPGSRLQSSEGPDFYLWEDRNWRVGYRIEEIKRWLFLSTRIITIVSVTLIEPINE